MDFGTKVHKTITLYMLNRVTGDMHGAIAKCWSVVAGTSDSGRQTSELCLNYGV